MPASLHMGMALTCTSGYTWKIYAKHRYMFLSCKQLAWNISCTKISSSTLKAVPTMRLQVIQVSLGEEGSVVQCMYVERR